MKSKNRAIASGRPVARGRAYYRAGFGFGEGTVQDEPAIETEKFAMALAWPDLGGMASNV